MLPGGEADGCSEVLPSHATPPPHLRAMRIQLLYIARHDCRLNSFGASGRDNHLPKGANQ